MVLMDPTAQLPERLQKRPDSWQYNLPAWCCHFGGRNDNTRATYFSLKIPPPTHFLVKPQTQKVPQADDDDEQRRPQMTLKPMMMVMSFDKP